MPDKKLNGRCLCGKIQFELTPPTDFVSHCHCRSCRLSHGSAFVTWTSVPKERFLLKRGEDILKWYPSSEWIEWGFCSNCGSPIFYRATKPGHPESPKETRMYVSAGSLENLDQTPKAHVSFEERAPWFQMNDNLPKYKGKGEERIEG